MDLLKGGVPLYLQLAGILRRRIQAKEYHGQIPPENALTGEFKVSRFTVRQAIDVLRREGLLYAKQGVGTLLAPTDKSKYVIATGDLEDLVYWTNESTVKILRKETLRADRAKDQVASNLQIAPQEKVFCYTTVRFFGTYPFSYSRVYLPLSLGHQIPSGRIRDKPIFKLIEEHCHIPVTAMTQRISAIAAGPEFTRVLKVKSGEPMLYLNRIYHSAEGRPVELSVVFYDVKKLEYTIKLLRQAALESGRSGASRRP
jgi:GntR family transcriptional regulator